MFTVYLVLTTLFGRVDLGVGSDFCAVQLVLQVLQVGDASNVGSIDLTHT